MQTGIHFPDISPEIFSFSLFGFELALRWYALAYIVGILIGWRIALAAVRRPALWSGKEPPLSAQQLEALLTWIIVGVIVGGRLGYVLIYKPMEYLASPLSILRIDQGGMSFHGGFLGVVVVVLLFSRNQKIPLGSLADIVALAATPAILLARIANFVNAELWGRPTTLPWGVIFPGEAAQHCPGISGPGLMEFCARHPSQLYEAAIEGLLLGALLLWLAFRRGAFKTPWLLSAVFFTVYGLGRFLVEFVRQPDAHFVGPGNPLGLALHVNGWGLTMGQLLSLPMILVGLWLLLRLRRGTGAGTGAGTGGA